MDVAILGKRAAEIAGHLEAITHPDDDDADKQAILVAASGIYGAKIARDTLRASILHVLGNIGK